MGPLWWVTQCAAVMARSRCGLRTTLAVQKWLPSPPERLVENSAPTAGVPRNETPVGIPAGAGVAALRGTEFIAAASRTASFAAPCAAGVMATITRAVRMATPAAQERRLPIRCISPTLGDCAGEHRKAP